MVMEGDMYIFQSGSGIIEN